MAEAYLKYVLKKLNMEDKVQVFSCGINADVGDKATDYAKEAIAAYGVNLGQHRAKSIQQFDLASFDKILVMTAEHKRKVCSISPEVACKVELLKKYMTHNTAGYMNIDDPWGLSREVYKSCAAEIVNCVDNLAIKLLEKGG